MGNRLHCAKTYKVEYGETTGFNWGVQEFHYLLDNLGVYYTGESWDDTFDVYKDEFKVGINKLRDYDNLTEDERFDIYQNLKELGYTREETIEKLESYLKESEESIDYIHFCFF